MTIQPTDPSNTVALPDNFNTGLDEFDSNDATIPRLQIQHHDGKFKDSLSNEEFEKVDVIILGLVKQRILWDAIMDEEDKPVCKSTNHHDGYPQLVAEEKGQKLFPIEKSGFDLKDYPPDENGDVALPCAGCALKEWGSHPDGKKPYCSEQYTLPVLYAPTDGVWVPALMTFQKTGLKPLKSYLTGFSRSKTPAFQAITQIGLDLRSFANNPFCVPNFKKVGETDMEDWIGYSTSYEGIAEFLRMPPTRQGDDVPVSAPVAATAQSTVTITKPAPAAQQPAATVTVQPPAAPVAAETTPAPVAAETDDSDELPF